MSIRTRTYGGLRQLETFEDRFDYLSLKSGVGNSTFGFERWVNQRFYTSREWRHVRHDIIARDEGRDLGMADHEIFDKIIIHHIIPMTIQDFDEGNPLILDPDNLITTCHDTHNAIHFGDRSSLRQPIVERRPGDTTLWTRRGKEY